MAGKPKKNSVDGAIDSVTNGPVAETAKVQTEKTKAEFADLANARTTPEQPAATGQPLTRERAGCFLHAGHAS